ncbi:carbohydrate kinase [Aquimarina sp. MMG016]|uniref:carbohydrate kinase family protein n=1 Tax=Aquimarina sp. MMG016 TaxID=2822690 RepID=UPI001B39DCC1|nr:carbohydrate kinase [Aquimarina sp. MMG016]MBQ4820992.1 carbohydrate kinase [Aquimarina sp. MMG016]
MKITCFGEVLWDIFPNHKKIGGAPLNVALRLHTMGIESSIITRIGDDDLGNEIISYIKEQEVPSETVQKDKNYPTGEVLVTLDKEGTATYEISRPVAWDFIEISDVDIEEVHRSDAIIFGSLACRNATSRNTLFKLLDQAKFKILDVNLRPPHYSTELLLELMNKANFIKLNDEELNEISIYFKIKETTLEDQLRAVAKYTNTDQICITKGGKGATLFYKGSFFHNSGYKVKVIDTVGAGDSFLATLISKLLQESNPQTAIDYACAIGAMVAGSEGANPVFSEDEIKTFISEQL